MTRRPWKVMPGFPTGHLGSRITYDNSGTGIRCRSFATEEAARAAATEMTTPDEDNCCFAAVRLFGQADYWSCLEVDEYRPGCPGEPPVITHLDLRRLP